MSASSMASLLVVQGFFASVPENVAATISELTSERKAGIDELLFRQGDRADHFYLCLLYTSPSPRDGLLSRMPSSA